jgi:hypothetical protein
MRVTTRHGDTMDQMLHEIEAAVRGNAWMLALSATLALPDICAALQSPNGETKRSKYENWVQEWLGDKYPDLDASELYQMRCSMLHQGKSQGSSYSRVIFVAPGSNFFHNNILNDALNLDLPTFCSDVASAVRKWQAAVEGSPDYIRNSVALMRWYPNGLPPYIVGVSVLS